MLLLFNMLELDFSQNNTPEYWLSKISEQLNNPLLPDWQRSVYSFLQEWFLPTDFVKVYTSGSTGEPKSLQVSKTMMRISALKTLQALDLKSSDTALLCLSANYIAGKMMIVRAIAGQLRLFAVEPASTPLRHCGTESSSADLQSPVSFDFSAMVPAQVFEQLNEKSSLEKIKKLLIGGGAVSSELDNKLQALNTCIAYETYGMTETVSHIALRKVNGKNKQTAFALMPNISVKTDNRGCLVIFAPDLLPEPLITNDLAEIFPNGNFRITGRIDNIINSGGIKIQPEELERKIASFFTKSFLISSVKDEKWGESLILVAEENIDKNTFEEINKLLPKAHQIKLFVHLPEIPRTSVSEKISRIQVKEWLENRR